jgi:ATP-dependent RNA helicase HelY
VRGSTRAVIEERRPVPLHNLFLAGERRSDRLLLLPTFVEDRPNPKAAALTERSRAGLFSPPRTMTVELLHEQGLLPAIYFIFSRAGCDEGVRQCMREGRRLTGPEERRQIRELAEDSVRHLSDADLTALGYGNWLAGLEAGFAAHHAGLVPPFKEAVERCFGAGLVKVVFATETLSLGINMPARCVVIERLSKYGGDGARPLTPGEYTQLTGRAGRRGTDEEGYAVVSWSPGVGFEQVAALAGARSYTLVSSFRPTYNMATNLVRRCTPEQAHHLLNLSFAQYRADADVVRLESYLERARAELAGARARAACDRGDIWAYRQLVEAAPERGDGRGRGGAEEIVAALEELRPGDVVLLPARKGAGSDRVAVLSTSQRKKGDPSVRAITAGRRLVSLAPRDFRWPPRPLARLELPAPFAPRDRGFQKQVALQLAAARPASGPRPSRSRPGAGHPVAGCADAPAHLRAAARADRLARQVARLERQVQGRSESLARQFDRVLQVLERWGYVQGWALTPAGGRLARIYHEQDLLVAECAQSGVFDGLRPAEVAAVASLFTYERRGPAQPDGVPARLSPRVEERWRAVQALSWRLNHDEEEGGLPLTRPADPGFATAVYHWARGHDLARALGPAGPPSPARGTFMAAGDFVRNVKQLVDLLRQLSEVLPDPASAEAASQAVGLVFRGVVAASSVVGDTHRTAFEGRTATDGAP